MKAVHIIGVPLDLGGGRRGVDMGPSAFRIAGLGERLAALGYTVTDKGDLPAPIPKRRSCATSGRGHSRHRQGLPEATRRRLDAR
jgi:arginase